MVARGLEADDSLADVWPLATPEERDQLCHLWVCAVIGRDPEWTGAPPHTAADIVLLELELL